MDFSKHSETITEEASYTVESRYWRVRRVHCKKRNAVFLWTFCI
jgi:hypothetical protein